MYQSIGIKYIGIGKFLLKKFGIGSVTKTWHQCITIAITFLGRTPIATI